MCAYIHFEGVFCSCIGSCTSLDDRSNFLIKSTPFRLIQDERSKHERLSYRIPKQISQRISRSTYVVALFYGRANAHFHNQYKPLE